MPALKNMKERIPVCPHEYSDNIAFDLRLSLERLERDLHSELIFSSGLRCPVCNKIAGGADNSAHLRGLAVDIKTSGSLYRFRIVSAVLAQGFVRVGVAKTFIHVDVDTSLPQRVLWLY